MSEILNVASIPVLTTGLQSLAYWDHESVDFELSQTTLVAGGRRGTIHDEILGAVPKESNQKAIAEFMNRFSLTSLTAESPHRRRCHDMHLCTCLYR